MKILLFLFSFSTFSESCLAQDRLRLVCNTMVDPSAPLTGSKWRVDQFLFEDPDKPEAAVYWHPWGGARLVATIQPQKMKVISHRAERFPNTFTIIAMPENAYYQFKIRLNQSTATGPDFSAIDVKAGYIDNNGEVSKWDDWTLKDASNGNEPAGACKYNKFF